MFLARCNVLYRERKTGYPLSTVATRGELKALIDQLPEPRLEIEQRFRETRKPGTIGGMAGGGSMGML